MYEINYNGRTPYASNYFYCCIQPKGLLYDVERDLLAIAKFFVQTGVDSARFLLVWVRNVAVSLLINNNLFNSRCEFS